MKLNPQVYRDAAKNILKTNVVMFDDYVRLMDEYFENEWSSPDELCLQFLFMAEIVGGNNAEMVA